MYVCLLGFDSEMVLLFSCKFCFPHNFGAWKGTGEEKKKERKKQHIKWPQFPSNQKLIVEYLKNISLLV